MKLDPVKFKEHLARMRRDREMELQQARDDYRTVRMAVGGGTAAEAAAGSTTRGIEREINLLAELYAAVEESMETDAGEVALNAVLDRG